MQYRLIWGLNLFKHKTQNNISQWFGIYWISINNHNKVDSLLMYHMLIIIIDQA